MDPGIAGDLAWASGGERTIDSAPHELFGPVGPDLERLEADLLASIEEDGEPMAGPMLELFRAGGKRLRPSLVLLFASFGRSDLGTVAPAAMAVELTHAATLVHDDVIDRSPTRRGRPTVASALGEQQAIVVADFYFAKAYREASRCGSEVVDRLARAVMNICTGELLQQAARYHYRGSVADYMRRIELKTASLLSISCEIGALLGGFDEERRRAAADCGREMGLAFQIADDVLDYVGTEADLGKPVGHDLVEGSATLPLLLAIQDGQLAPALNPLLPDGGQLSALEVARIVELIRQSAVPALALEEARAHARSAAGLLGGFPEGPAKRSLGYLAHHAVERRL